MHTLIWGTPPPFWGSGYQTNAETGLRASWWGELLPDPSRKYIYTSVVMVLSGDCCITTLFPNKRNKGLLDFRRDQSLIFV